MPRPRSNHTGLPSYCYRDKKSGSLYMMHPDGTKPDGTLKLRRRTYADLTSLLAAWRTTWGEASREGMQTMGDLLDAYLAELVSREKVGEIAQSTVDDYTRCILSLRPVWERVRIVDVDVPALYRWQRARGEDARVRANRERTVLFEAFKIAMREGLVKENPVQHLEPFREKPRDRYVTDDEFMAVFDVAPQIVQAAMLIAAVTGLRQGDILRLRRADFGETGLTVRTRKTGQPLEFAWTEGLRRAVLAAVGARDFVPMVLLSTQDGKQYTSDGFRTMWQRAMVDALDASRPAPAAEPRLRRFTFNDLRAKAGSESRDWRLLGHMDQRTFERVYNRLPRKVTPTR